METLLENRYRVIQTLGSGGFGETFLAEDTQMPSSRRCVVKQLKPIHNNPQIYQLVQERFQREAAILEDLGSYNDQIPALYAYFQSDGQFYVIQEWVQGDTLTAKFRQQGVFSESAVKDILVNLLPVLEYVHSKRIIHRDIKPDNIILRHRDSKPILIDFGAVRESMGTVFNSQGLPTSSIVIGTPGYMPSEQAAGRPMYSSDIYSLGMTAIYLLTGKQPHELDADPRNGEIIWRTHALSVSPTLAGVIDRAIAYHPRERFTTAREMLQALQLGAAAFPPTVGTPQSIPEKTISVSPAVSPQPANQSNGKQRILVGSLITGGLIAAVAIISFANNNNQQPQTVDVSTPVPTEQPTISTPISSLPSETPTAEPQTPTRTSTTTSTEKPYLGFQMVTLTPENRENFSSRLGVPITLNNGVLVFTVVPGYPASIGGLRVGDVIRNIDNQIVATDEEALKLIANSTIGNPLSIEVERNGQVFQVTVIPATRPSPEKVIQDFYGHINRREYEAAWNYLSKENQNTTGFNSFRDWWQQVKYAEIQQLTSQELSNDTATIDAQVSYSTTSGRNISQSLRFFLKRETSSPLWLIDKTERL
ncbi:protein kinase domain-containing protein [Anabaena sp. UHCC 0399]|uniref:protein kinase domain-containing protein n=1 Tax=Anabaena sp. UHCC 0399 TaxID=3110238 RepID=UPI002B1E995B|nr:protein kinase [Anabaena sp. UHCC 0399]MEA5568329.1 protein kinase [Anabaena sp. UHCC 0399]